MSKKRICDAKQPANHGAIDCRSSPLSKRNFYGPLRLLSYLLFFPAFSFLPCRLFSCTDILVADCYPMNLVMLSKFETKGGRAPAGSEDDVTDDC